MIYVSEKAKYLFLTCNEVKRDIYMKISRIGKEIMKMGHRKNSFKVKGSESINL